MLHIIETALTRFASHTDAHYSRNYFKNFGFEVLGHGAFAFVLGMPNCHYAYKVGPLSDGWLLWAAFCRKHSSPYAPKIEFIKRNEKRGYYIAKVERYKETYYQLEKRAENVTEWYRLVTTRLIVEQCGELMFAGLKKFLDEARQYATENGVFTDLHDENVMLRHDGSLVITDPFSWAKNDEHRTTD